MADALSDGPGNDGLFQRFQILVWPDVSKTWKLVDKPPDTAAQNQVSGVFEGLLHLTIDDALTLKFEHDAQDLFYKWLTELEEKRAGR